MAEFTEVMKQRERMCEYFKKRCYKCLLNSCNNGKEMICENFIFLHSQEAEEIIMKWASEHPIITNADKFKEVFGVNVKCNQLGCAGIKADCSIHCEDCKYHGFWNQEYKEPGEVDHG